MEGSFSNVFSKTVTPRDRHHQEETFFQLLIIEHRRIIGARELGSQMIDELQSLGQGFNTHVMRLMNVVKAVMFISKVGRLNELRNESIQTIIETINSLWIVSLFGIKFIFVISVQK